MGPNVKPTKYYLHPIYPLEFSEIGRSCRNFPDPSLWKMPKTVHFGDFWKPEVCGQTVLPDRSILIEQKLVKMPKHKNSNATFLAIFKHCEILNLLLKSGNTVAINWLVIKLAGHSELTTKTVFCCHFFSFKPFVFKFRVPLAKKGFFMVASMILLSTSVFPKTLNIPGNQKWHFKECWSWAAKMSNAKYLFWSSGICT